MNKKKLLVLGGKPIGSCEIVNYAKSMGIYTIVTDYLPKEESFAKTIADEEWNISTSENEKLKKLIIENKIDGVYAGVHEFNIERMIEICSDLGLPCFCNLEQWKILNNKEKFKQLCKKYDIPVTKEYNISSKLMDSELESIDYPVIIKPVDGSGSRGFSICNNAEELKNSYNKAVNNSKDGGVLIEQYMNYKNSVIINYTLVDGEIYYSGIGDKHSKKVFEEGAPIMSIVTYPSHYEKKYIEDLNEKVKDMFKGIELKNGVIWIEAFCDNGRFTFNEMGYRFGGSLTYFPVQYNTGIDQLGLQIDYAVNGKYTDLNHHIQEKHNDNQKKYIVLPVHVRPGKIQAIEGIEELKKNENLQNIVFVHHCGDIIQNWGSAQQVFAYIHFTVDNDKQIDSFVEFIMNTVKVLDENGNNLLFNLYETN